VQAPVHDFSLRADRYWIRFTQPHRPAPGPLPSWAESDYVNHNIAEFQRTGFHGGLNYYRAAEPYFDLSATFKGAKITQPSFFIWGKADGFKELYPLTIDQMRAGLPGLVGGLELDNVGHWVQHEAHDVVSDQLVKFLRRASDFEGAPTSRKS
jgi:pimeloyl-ACP methyl ester carboxylesterase